MAAVSEGSTFRIDWDAIERRTRTVGGGSGQVDWDSLGDSEEEGKNLFNRAVDGVRGFLKGFHLPKLRGEAPAAMPPAPESVAATVEPAEEGRNRFFGWLGEQKRRFDEWRQSGGGEEGEEEGESEVPVMTEEGEADRFGWLKNGLEWLRGAPGGLFNKFRRKEEAVAMPEISREERVKALKEGTKQFVEQHGQALIGGLLGIAGAGVGAAVVSPENIGVINAFIMEFSAMGVSAMSLFGLVIGDKRGPEFIPEAEKAYQRPIRAIQRLCSQRGVRSGLFLTAASSAGFVAGGLGRMVVDTLQIIQQGAAAGVPGGAEVSSPVDIASAVGDTRREAIEAAQQGLQQAAQFAAEQTAIQDIVGQSETAFTQAGQTLSSINADLLGNSQVNPLAEKAQEALRIASRYYSDAMASGGIDAAEAARLQDLARQAQAAVDQAVNTANQIVQQAADAQAAVETARQATLQAGAVMKDVIVVATPSQTAFEALQQQVFQATGSPYAVEAANALSWSLPKADITGLHTGAISEAAKTVVNLIGQAHDYTAGRGVEYTINSIRQAVDAGQLSADVLKAVEAANAPVGEVKAAAQTGLNTILQGIIK